MARVSKSIALLALLAGVGHSPVLLAAACANVATGNWSAAGTWAAPCNVAGGPTAADTVTIINNTTVTVDNAGMAASSVTVSTGANASTLTFAAGSSLAVTNNVVVNLPTASVTKGITVLTGTLTVGGNVTLNGGTAAARDALLTVSSGLITINGGLIINATVATSSTASITAAGGRITVNGAAGVTNGDVVTVGAGTFSVTNAAATFSNTSATNVASTTVSTGTLSVTGNLTNAAAETMTVSSIGNVTVAGTLTNNGTITLTTTGTVNANGDFTNSATGVFTNTAAGNLNIGGNATMSGTFNRGTGTVTFNGAAAQALGGTVATTFNNLTINKASNDLTINTTPTVNGTLTLTKGDLVTGANRVILGTAATIATPSANSYVVGSLQKNYTAGAALSYFAGNNFPVGDATNFTPVNVSAGTTTTAGSLTVSTFTPDHPQVATPIASTGIDAARSANRYWRFNNSGLTVGTAISATFTFVAGDVDASANTANFIVERYDGTNWNPTTLVAANALNTQASNITPLIAGNNDFAVGDPFSGFNGIPGAFNAFEAGTPANAILGRIYTKIVGTAITLQVVAVNAGRTAVNAAYNTNPITVDLLDARDNTGAVTAATNCRSTWFPPGGPAVISTQSLSPVWTSGRSATTSITAPANAWRDVRVRVTQAGNIGCSTDRFSIRPTVFSSVTSSNATNSGTSGAPSFKTGQSFNLTAATGLTGYDNGSGATLASPQIIPLIDSTKVVGSPTAGTIGGSFGAASGGTATGAAFSYSEVGNFGLSANAIYDNVFTAVDQPGDCTADFSNALAGGQYGCNFGSPAVALASGFGRFIPDHFALTVAGSLTQACSSSGGFSYLGQNMSFAGIKIEARNSANVKTNNYAGAYAKLDPATFNGFGFGARDTGGAGTNLTGSRITGATSGTWATGELTLAVGTFSIARAASLDGAFGATKIGIAPADSDSVIMQSSDFDIDVDGAGGNDHARVGGADTIWRFGRLFVPNTFGSQNLDLRIPIEAQYWTGTQWQRNVLDSCTAVVVGNVALGNYAGGLNAINMGPTHIQPVVAIAQGVGQITLTKPAGAATGSLSLAVNLGTGATGSICTPPIWIATATGANLLHLQDKWCGAVYDKDPVGTINFGVVRNRFIYNRENF